MNEKILPRPVWAEINLDALAHNMKEVRKCIKPTTLATAVIKADGYGHGAVQIAKTLLENGADRLAVATLSEALQLRKAFPDVTIMILGYTPNDNADEVIENRIIQGICSIEQAKHFAKRCEVLNMELKVHIKLDTGMRRIGMEISEQTVIEIIEMSKLSKLVLEGIFTHFAVADEVDKTFTALQVEKFLHVVEALKAQNVEIPIKHVCNSAGIIDCPEYQFDMVRAGIMLYGLYPSEDVDHENVKLREVMTLKAQISHVKTVLAGEGLSYGLKYKTQNMSRIATLPLGYADGFSRGYTGKAFAIVQDELRPVVGRICMDQCMLEVSGLEVKVGDTVALFGTHNDQFVSIDEYAHMINTINYEVVCMISKRVPRIYTKENQVVEIVDFLRK